ncbi:helix-turn-helix domain-containing protein, partial [Pseudomonas aeruginosa]
SGGLQVELAAGGAIFRQLSNEVRRKRASEMLLAGRAIRQVAKACGFAELSPFYRAFRRWHAAPPEQYRERLAKREEGYSTSGT